jgi:lipoprotein signal peptidase
MTETNTEEGNARLRAEQGHMNRLSGTLPDLKAHLIFWSIATAGLLLDIWTKNAVFDWLGQQPSQNVSIINGFLRFIIAYNDGAAFSFLAGKSNFIIVF